MTEEYISRKEAENRVFDIPLWGGCARYYIRKVPTANVAPVKKGEWVQRNNEPFECSVCGRTAPYETGPGDTIMYWPDLNFCPYCGAKMR